MEISVEFSESEMELIQGYAAKHGVGTSVAIHDCTMGSIEDWIDTIECEKAIERFEKSVGKTYTHEEVRRILGIDS